MTMWILVFVASAAFVAGLFTGGAVERRRTWAGRLPARHRQAVALLAETVDADAVVTDPEQVAVLPGDLRPRICEYLNAERTGERESAHAKRK